MMYCITNPRTGVASYLESIKSAELQRIEKINAFYGK
jgi:hypothetical protein